MKPCGGMEELDVEKADAELWQLGKLERISLSNLRKYGQQHPHHQLHGWGWIWIWGRPTPRSISSVTRWTPRCCGRKWTWSHNHGQDDDDDYDNVGDVDENINLSLQPSIWSNYEACRSVLAPVAGAFTFSAKLSSGHRHHCHHGHHHHCHHGHHRDAHCGWRSRPCAGGRRGGGTLDVRLAQGGPKG